MQTSILVVDDEIKIIEVIKLYLESDGYKVFSAINGNEALEKYEKYKPHLIILDLMLPDISGEKICCEIRKTSQVPIIMLTSKSAEEDILNGYSLGSDDYMTKPFSPKQLLAKVKAILKRVEKPKSSKLEFNGELTIDTKSYEVIKNGEEISLTSSEYKLLILMAKNPNRVFTRSEMLDAIAKDNIYVYDRIIDSHVKNLRFKIENDSKNPKYIKTIHGVGYKFDDKEI